MTAPGAPPAKNLSGTLLGPYEVLDRLGAGGMGEVYRARDTRLQRDVALKVLPAEVSADADRLRRFATEARAASALNHPNIVTVYDIGSADGVFYIVMELVQGKALRELLPLPLKRMFDIAGQLANGLARAHEAGVVHRDIKPENVMVTKDGTAKILDFGLAKRARAAVESGAGEKEATVTLATQPGVVLGTVRYMSPEQAAGRPADFRSDQFSFGSVLYEMATGKFAFTGDTNVDTLSAILHAEPEPAARVNPQLPPPLGWIIERCLAKDAKDRYASTEDLARDLSAVRERLAEGSGAGQTPAGAMGSTRRVRLRATVAGVALLAFGLAAGLVIDRRVRTLEPPVFRQLTYRAGAAGSAFFAPDGQTIVYSAGWEHKPIEIFLNRIGSPESRPFGMSGTELLAISRSGEMAVALHSHGVEPWIDAGTLALVGMASVGAPREVLEEVSWADWSPDARELAIVHEVGGRSRLEYPIGRVLYEETAGFLSHPRVSRDGKRVAFLDHPVRFDDAGGVAVVDRSGNKTPLAPGFSSVWGLGWSPDGSEVWFTGAPSGANRALYAVGFSGHRRLLSRVIGSTRLNDVAPSGRVLLTHDQRTEHVVALPPGERKDRDLSWLDYSLGRAISPDGRMILFVEGGEGAGSSYAVFIRGTDGSPATRLGDGDAQALSPDGSSALAILQQAGGSRLVIYPTRAGQARVLPPNGLDMLRADWLPDGKRLLISAAEKGHASRLYLQNVTEDQPRAISPDGYSAFTGAVSLDGKVVVARGPDRRLFLFPIEGGEPMLLSALSPDDAPCGWSSDGRLYLASGPVAGLAGGGIAGRPRRIDLFDVRSGKRVHWKELGSDDGATAIHITPDGQSYVYSYVHTQADLFLVEGLK